MKFSPLLFVPVALVLLVQTSVSRAAASGPGQAALPAEMPGDKYVLPQGAGSRDGSSWKNALDAGSMQAAWDGLRPGQVLWIGSGQYKGGRLTISSGGEAGKLKTVAGKDTGAGLPVFSGNFDRNNAAKTLSVFIAAANGADYWSVRDIQLRDYGIGIASKAGGHVGVRIDNLDVTGCREGISISGGGSHENPDAASNDWIISNCDFKNFTKRGIRFKDGNYNFTILNCLADAGGKEWATEPFQMGYSLEGAGAHKPITAGAYERDITFINCVAQNAYHDNGDKYWNGDGFCSERHIKNLKFINCYAFDNTDGGWDVKAENVTLENCVAIGNKKNYRMWGKSNILSNSLSAYSVWPGGSGGTAGLWTNGVVQIDRSSFVDSSISADPGARVTVTNSLLARTRASTSTVPLGAREGVTLENTVVWDEGSGQGQNPGLVAPASDWNGSGDAFNSKLGAGKGYSMVAVQMPGFTRTPLEPGSRSATKKTAGRKPATPAVAAAPKTAAERAADAAIQPVLANGGFEKDLAGWAKAKAPAWEVKTGDAAEGEKFAVLNTEKRSEAEVQLTGLVVGEKYSLSYSSRGNTSGDARIIVRGGPGNQYISRGSAATGAAWTARTLTFTAPATELALQVSVRSAGKLELDGFKIERAG